MIHEGKTETFITKIPIRSRKWEKVVWVNELYIPKGSLISGPKKKYVHRFLMSWASKSLVCEFDYYKKDELHLYCSYFNRLILIMNIGPKT